MKPVIIIAYSGHAYVAIDALRLSGRTVTAYCDREEKKNNPYGLNYLGSENDTEAKTELTKSDYFVGVGDNTLRKKITLLRERESATATHPRSVISDMTRIGDGCLLAANCVVNALAEIGRGAIINSGSIVEHECLIGNFAHVAPGAVLSGNVTVGEGAFVGAGSVVKQGVTIGAWAVVGAGAVVIHDVPAGATVVGNPAHEITYGG